MYNKIKGKVMLKHIKQIGTGFILIPVWTGVSLLLYYQFLKNIKKDKNYNME